MQHNQIIISDFYYDKNKQFLLNENYFKNSNQKNYKLVVKIFKTVFFCEIKPIKIQSKTIISSKHYKHLKFKLAKICI